MNDGTRRLVVQALHSAANLLMAAEKPEKKLNPDQYLKEHGKCPTGYIGDEDDMTGKKTCISEKEFDDRVEKKRKEDAEEGKKRDEASRPGREKRSKEIQVKSEQERRGKWQRQKDAEDSHNRKRDISEATQRTREAAARNR